MHLRLPATFFMSSIHLVEGSAYTALSSSFGPQRPLVLRVMSGAQYTHHKRGPYSLQDTYSIQIRTRFKNVVKKRLLIRISSVRYYLKFGASLSCTPYTNGGCRIKSAACFLTMFRVASARCFGAVDA